MSRGQQHPNYGMPLPGPRSIQRVRLGFADIRCLNQKDQAATHSPESIAHTNLNGCGHILEWHKKLRSSSSLTDYRASVGNLVRSGDVDNSLYVRLPSSLPVRVVSSQSSCYFGSRPMCNSTGRRFCIDILLGDVFRNEHG